MGGKNGALPVGENGLILGLYSVVIGDLPVAEIDPHQLGGDGVSAPRLPDAQDHVGAKCLRRLQNFFRRLAEGDGKAQLGQKVSARLLGQTGHRLPGGIDGFTAEGVKAGDEQVFHGTSLLSWFIHITTKRCKKQENAQMGLPFSGMGLYNNAVIL